MPADRVTALRRALEATLEDKVLLAEGEEAQALVTKRYALPQKIIACNRR